jgi:pentatricopeptide repeat protein
VAEEWLDRMDQIFPIHAKPDVYSFIATMNGYAKASSAATTTIIARNNLHRQNNYHNNNQHRKQHNPDAPKRLLEKLIRWQGQPGYENLQPNASLYTALMDAHANQPDSGPMVERLLDQIEQLYVQDPNLDQRPSRKAYGVTIRAWGNSNRYFDAPDRATEILRRMETLSMAGRDDLLPDVVTYTLLIQAWSQSSRSIAPDRAMTILRHMERLQEHGNHDRFAMMRPNTTTYNAVLHAYARKGRAREAHELLEEMKSRSSIAIRSHDVDTIQPNAISWATVIHAYSRCSSDRDDAGACAYQLLEELAQEYADTKIARLQPTPAICSSTILAQNNAEAAEDVFWNIVEHHAQRPFIFPLTTFVCNGVLLAWAKSNEAIAPQRAENILEWMINTKISPDETSLAFVIDSWERSNRKNAAEHIQMLKQRFPFSGA